MRKNQIAAQLYTVRDFVKDAAGLAASCKKIKAIGYAAVQISGVGPIPAAEIRRICEGEGLPICATHEGGQNICENTPAVIERLNALNCRYTAYPYPHKPLRTLDDIKRVAEQIDRAGAAMRAAGQVLCYHNHACEFLRVGGKTVLEWLYDLCDPLHLQGEPDTFWVQKGGQDPARWCAKLSGRLPLLHLKEYATVYDAEGKEQAGVISSVGSGTLDWAGICHAADAAGCKWFIVEQDTCPADPFDALASSFRYLDAQIAQG